MHVMSLVCVYVYIYIYINYTLKWIDTKIFHSAGQINRNGFEIVFITLFCTSLSTGMVNSNRA